MKNLGSETNVKIYQEKNFWNIIRILFLTNNHYRATLRFARNDEVVGTIVVEGTDCRAALRFARNDGDGDDCDKGDCGGLNRLPRCTAFRSQ